MMVDIGRMANGVLDDGEEWFILGTVLVEMAGRTSKWRPDSAQLRLGATEPSALDSGSFSVT